MRKKHLAFFLAFILGCTLLAVPASADGAVLRVTPPDSYPKVGESFEVTVELEGNPGMKGIQLTLCFDRDSMRCTEIVTGDLLRDMLLVSNEEAPSGAILAAASSDAVTRDGRVAVFSFEALRDISAWDFSLEGAEIITVEYASIPPTIAIADTVEPTDTPDPTPSDNTEDGETTEKTEQTLPAPQSGTSTGENADNGSTARTGSGIPTGGDNSGSGNTDTGSNSGNTDTTGSATGESAGADEAEEPVAILFADTEGHWGAEFIAKAVQLKLFQGYSDSRFGPDDPVTRGQYVTVLYRMAGSPEVTGQTPFTDISDQIPEFQSAILWAYQNGYVNGRTADSFDPVGQLTRQEAMKILFGYSGGESGMELMFTQIYNDSFTDSGEIADWARPAMYWAFYHTLITGTSDSTLGPLGTATRAQLAKILVNYTEM
ncbi:MAG: S-layer homology domain-containing protein [Oscillospiraceae bacterium]|nr:S-layer homology domain-containing protein [Oscillospiraceae bacterium]